MPSSDSVSSLFVLWKEFLKLHFSFFCCGFLGEKLFPVSHSNYLQCLSLSFVSISPCLFLPFNNLRASIAGRGDVCLTECISFQVPPLVTTSVLGRSSPMSEFHSLLWSVTSILIFLI